MMDVSINICLHLLKEVENDFEAELAALKQLHMQRVVGSGRWEEARRRADHLRHKMTTPVYALQSLEKQLAQYRDRLTELLGEAAPLAIKIEHAEREASAYRWLLEERKQNRATKPATGLYPSSKRVIDELYEDHNITQGHFSALDSQSIAELAKWLRDRHAAASAEAKLESTRTGHEAGKLTSTSDDDA